MQKIVEVIWDAPKAGMTHFVGREIKENIYNVIELFDDNESELIDVGCDFWASKKIISKLNQKIEIIEYSKNEHPEYFI